MTRHLMLLLCPLCSSLGAGGEPGTGGSTPPPDWLEWKARRLEAITGTNGWTTLIARHWLTEGTHSAGSYPTNEIVLPEGRAAGAIGRFVRTGRTVRFEAAPGMAATVDGQSVTAVAMNTDHAGHPTKLTVGTLSFVVIERGDRLGLRVRDPEAPARRQFPGLQYFPYDPAWRINGRFEAFAQARTLHVPDVIGGTQEFPSPGAVVFTVNGREHRLDVADEGEGEDFFVMLRDQTSGDRTYGSGRFLYVPRPDAQGRVVIDFNRAYTPPCGFTEFATCPLPPRQNWLPIPIRAGELAPPSHH